MTEPDDQRLLHNLRAGRPEACAELIRAHYPTVYRFLLHLTHDVHQAEDLTQETFAAAWEKSAAFEGRASLATWLHRIAYTKFIDARRAQRRATRMLECLSDAKVLSSEPFDALLVEDEVQHLYRMIQGLGEPERTLLVLHYFQGLSYREMASVLDEPAGTVKWRTSEALNRLRMVLKDEVDDHAPRETSESGPGA